MIEIQEIYLGLKFLLSFTELFPKKKVFIDDLNLESRFKKNKIYKSKIYRTKKILKKEKIIFLAHGMSGFGIDDDRLFELARNISSLGFVVITPELEEIKSLKIQKETVLNIKDCFLAIEKLFPNSEIGFFSVSFSAGIGLVSFSDPEISTKIKSILAVGPFFDLANTLEFVVENFEKDDYGAYICFYNFFDSYFKGENLKKFFYAKAFDNGIKRIGTSLELSPLIYGKLKKSEKEIEHTIRHNKIFRKEITSKIISKNFHLTERISPKYFVLNTRADLNLIHGKNDLVIPETETKNLSNLLKENSIKHSVCFTELLSHGDKVNYLEHVNKIPTLGKAFGIFFKKFI